MTTPIAYFVFNRPVHTSESFAAIRAQRPSQLLIVADGPRAGHPTDESRCEAVRSILAKIDWPCDVKRNYADKNMGCKARVSSGLDWVFDQVDQAIILEDDCIPHPDFFGYCEALLEKYCADDRVWVITGNNFQDGKNRGDGSYYFSKYNHCWGWATWRRAWKNYRVDLPEWQRWKLSADYWTGLAFDRAEKAVWTDIIDRVANGEIDTWDYQWTACVWRNKGLTATPNVNLVTNIGFGPDATHTITLVDEQGLPTETLGPITHPSKICQNVAADRYVFNRNFGGKDHPLRLKNRLIARYQQLLRLPQWLRKKYISYSKKNL